MKKKILALLCLCIVTLSQQSIFAMSDALVNNCLLIDDTYFDSCPKYRKQVKMINEVLYDTWTQKESEVTGKNEMIEEVNTMAKKLKVVNAELYKTGQRTEEKAFFIGYMIEIMNLYTKELQTSGEIVGKAKSLFTKTYFNQPQEGLVISQIDLQDDAKRVLQFDEKVHLEISIRNFMTEAITQVEDIYCFANKGNETFIFPLESPIKLFEANSIKSINISMNTTDHALLENIGQKTIECAMVYFGSDNVERYTPYMPFTFTVQEA